MNMNMESFMSPFTNRRVKKNTKVDCPVFWCKVCQKDFPNVSLAVQHMTTGRSHKAKVRAKEEINHTASGLQKQRVNKIQNNSNDKVQKTVVQEPVTKKSKIEAEIKQRCDDCDLEFPSLTTALDHFKGKKHVKKIVAKAAAKLNQGNTRGSARGRARGRGNLNRGGRGVYNRQTFLQRDTVNLSGVSNDQELMGMAKDYYSHNPNKEDLGSNNWYNNKHDNYGNDGNDGIYGNNGDGNHGNSSGMNSNEKYVSVFNEIRDLERKLTYY